MRLKLYRAASLSQAMTSIRDELGPEALILSSRRVQEGVEVTAALELEPPEPAPELADAARMEALAWHGVPGTLAEELLHGPLDTALALALRFGELPLEPGARPLLLVGGPGAGKTLTVARLATRLVLGGPAPMVVTADGRRAGATEQLAAFTRLLGMNLIVASHPVSLARALARREDGVPVLIDAPGSDPFDPAQREETAALAEAASAAMALVMPAGLHAPDAAEQAAAYAALGAELMIATRLDVGRRLGSLLAAARSGGLALAEAGIGPGAADGLVRLTPALLAERLARHGHAAAASAAPRAAAAPPPPLPPPPPAPAPERQPAHSGLASRTA